MLFIHGIILIHLQQYHHHHHHHHQGSIRDRVLGKIISRAGETITPEINLLRTPINTYKYVDQDASLLDIKDDDVIEVIPIRGSIAESNNIYNNNSNNNNNNNMSSGNNNNNNSHNINSINSRSQYFSQDNTTNNTPRLSNSTHLPPHSSARDRVLGKIISNAVNTVTMDKNNNNNNTSNSISVNIQQSNSNQQHQQELTPRLSHSSNTNTHTHYSARDKILTKIISNAVNAAGNATLLTHNNNSNNNNNNNNNSQVHFPPISHSKDSIQPQETIKPSNTVYEKSPNLSSDNVSVKSVHQNSSQQSDKDFENDCLLLDYNEDVPPSYIETKKEPKTESRRRATFDQQLLQSTTSNEYFHVDLMDTQSDNRHFYDNNDNNINNNITNQISQENIKPRRHSEFSIRENSQKLERMNIGLTSNELNQHQHHQQQLQNQQQSQNQYFTNYQQIPHSPSKSSLQNPANQTNRRARNKILNRMVCRVKDTVLSSAFNNNQSKDPFSSDENSLSLKVKEKIQSPKHESNSWFQNNKFNNATVAVDNSGYGESYPETCHNNSSYFQDNNNNNDNKNNKNGNYYRPNHLKIQTDDYQISKNETKENNISSSNNSNNSNNNNVDKNSNYNPNQNPLRHLLSNTNLIIPPTEMSISPSERFSGKASPLHLNISTPQPYRETYRSTINKNGNSPEGRPKTPEKDLEHQQLERLKENQIEWSKGSTKQFGNDDNWENNSKDKWVDAAPISTNILRR